MKWRASACAELNKSVPPYLIAIINHAGEKHAILPTPAGCWRTSKIKQVTTADGRNRGGGRSRQTRKKTEPPTAV